MDPHPVFHADLADGPPGSRAWSAQAEDGTRLRIVTWEAGPRGTVLLFPGRSEHAEKYGRVARDLAALGWSSAAIDWRGQGHSDRTPGIGDRGHVDDFGRYQLDVAALLATVRAARLPEPLHLLAHSMGGTIGLRALAEGLPVASAAFSAPMWGIRMSAYLRPLAHGVSAVGRRAGLGRQEVPAGPRESYLAVTPFATNALTTCPDTYAWMVTHTERDPRLGLGRPTLQWLHAALADLRRLRRLPPPTVPVLVGIAGEETIVDNLAIHRLASSWPRARVETYDGARHELLMERPKTRAAFLAETEALFTAASTPRPAKASA
jgi:lysophospholipase